jgi:hypothetical protein
MNRILSKQYRRQAEDWCFQALRAAFPNEVVDDMDREELWQLAFPETHYMEVCKHTNRFDADGDPLTYKRMCLYKMSPRWIYKQIKRNPSITQEEMKELAA